jgi:hypothetical protein
MRESDALHVLLGNTIEKPEMDYDDERVNSESGDPVIDDGLQQYYFASVIDAMATKNFESDYKSVRGKIRLYSTEQQQLLAFSILQNLQEKYDFEFSLNFTPYNQDDIDELYKFIEFVEYDHEKFITQIWNHMIKSDGTKLDIETFCKVNEGKILKEIEEQTFTHYYSEMITDFLRTYRSDVNDVLKLQISASYNSSSSSNSVFK